MIGADQDHIIMQRVQAVLKASPDLLKPEYRTASNNPLAGHCYISSEVLAHLLHSWKPCFIRHEGAPHWYLKHENTGEILDATASQFKTQVPYHLGTRKGFLTKKLSKRAQQLLMRVEGQL